VDGVLTVSGTGGSDDVVVTQNVALLDPANPDQTQRVIGVEIGGDQTFYESSPGEISAIHIYDPNASDSISTDPNVSVPVERTSSAPVAGATQGISSAPTASSLNPHTTLWVGLPNGSLAPKK
jgi:hypothetical protein